MNNENMMDNSCPSCETAPKSDLSPQKTAVCPPAMPAATVTSSSASPRLFDRTDSRFAALFYLLGALYVYTLFFAANPSAFTLFAAVYLGIILLFAFAKNKALRNRLLFWPAATGLLAVSFLYDSYSAFILPKILMLTALGGYCAVALCGGLVDQKTSSALGADMLRCFFIFPFGNFFAGFGAFFAGPKKKEKQSGRWLNVFLGFLICIPLLCVILPLLLQADAFFGQLLTKLVDGLFFRFNLITVIFCFTLGLPVGLYFFGLCYGSSGATDATSYSRKKLDKAAPQRRILSTESVVTVLLVLSAVYFLFIALQTKVLFAAFKGVCPEGFYSFSEYARQGFFELCRVAALNLCILVLGRVLVRRPINQNIGLRRAEILICFFTFCLIFSAVGRMMLYISAYGLTLKRVGTLLILAFLTFIFVLVLLSQKKKINAVGIAAVVFVAGFVLFALSFPQAWIDRYNESFGYIPDLPVTEVWEG